MRSTLKKTIQYLSQKNRLPLFVFAFLFIFSIGSYALASFFPGQTTDPSCIPTDPTCFVDPFPSQTAHPGEFLTTDGSAVSWTAAAPSGLVNLNGLAAGTQVFAVGSGGLDFNISSAGITHTFNLPVADGAHTGKLSSADWAVFNNKLAATLASGNIFVGNGSNAAAGVALSGDATLSNSGVLTIAPNAVTTGKINANAVTYGKLQAASASSILLGSSSSGTAITEISLGGGLSISGTTLSSTAANTVGALNGVSKSANGATLSSGVLYEQTADASFPGLVSTGAQTFAGGKTFSASATFSAGLNAGGNIIASVAAPSAGTDAANKAYVDSLISGLQWKTSVRAATLVAGTLASSFENGDSVDGVTLATGDRILVKNQADQTENGIYTVNASGAPTRAADADTGSELVNAAVAITAGTQMNTAWTQTTPATITVGASNIVWVSFLSNTYLAGTGLTLTGGNTFNIDFSTATGTLAAAHGGTGLSAYGSANQLLGMNNAGTALEYKTFSTSGTAVSNDVGVTLSGAGATVINLPSASASVRGVLASSDWTAFNNKLTGTLASGNIFVGNGSNAAAGVALSGDATLSNSGVLTIAPNAVTTGKINAAAVTYAKIQNVATLSLLGNPTGSAAAPSEITLGSGLSFSGTTLIATGSGGSVTNVATDATLTGGPITTTGTLGLNLSHANTWTALQTHTLAGLGTTPSDAVLINNTTAAAAGAQQYSPSFELVGKGWKTASGGASQTVGFRMQAVPVQGVSAPTGSLQLDANINGSYTANIFNIDTSGNVGANSYNGFTLTTGSSSSNLFLGVGSGPNTAGGFHVAIGNGAGQNMLSGGAAGTTSVGYAALGGVGGSGTGSFDTVVGFKAGFNTTGSSNIIINSATSLSSFGGSGITSGSYNTYIGGAAGTNTSNTVSLSDGQGNIAFYSPSTHNVILGGGTTDSGAKLFLPAAPAASANYGTFSLGSGAWDGSTSGFFGGSSLGTSLSINEASGYLGNLADLQVAGISKLRLESSGNLIAAGNIYSKGLTWTLRTSPAANIWTSVAYGNGLYVAVPNSSSVVMTSPDGINWTSRSIFAANQWHSITYGNGLFVAVAGSGANQVMTSPDGITWTPRTAAANEQWLNVTYGNGLFVAVANDPASTNTIMTSPDGVTWTSRTSPSLRGWNSVSYGNGLYVAVAGDGSTSNNVMTSPDGITWTSRTSTAVGWGSVTYGNGLFVAVGNSGVIMTSPDGGVASAWVSRSGPVVSGWINVTYGNGLYVAVGGGGGTMTSPDGITWTGRPVVASVTWNGITYGNGLFVAVAGTGTTSNDIMTSGFTDYASAQNNNVHQGGTTFTGLNMLNQYALGTTASTGLLVQNTTSAALGAQQYSPSIELAGQGWKTASGGVSQTVGIRAQIVPVQGTSAPSGSLQFDANINGSYTANIASLSNTGAFTASDLITGLGGFSTASTAGYPAIPGGNFTTAGGSSASFGYTSSQALFAGASSVNFRSLFYGSSPMNASSSPSANVLFARATLAAASPTTYPEFANVVILAPNVTNAGGGTITNTASLYIDDAPTGGTNNYALQIASGGLSATGTIIFPSLVSCGGLQTNGAGVVSCTSDAAFKDVHSDFTAGLDAIMQIHPKTYSWKAGTYLYDGGVNYSGFIAQDVGAAIPEGVSVGSGGQLQLNTTTVLAAAVNAIKELDIKLDMKIEPLTSIDPNMDGSLASLIRSYLESATNGIHLIFADKVQTKELCLDDVCVTKAQLQQLLNAAAPASPAAGGEAGAILPPPSDPAPALDEAGDAHSPDAVAPNADSTSSGTLPDSTSTGDQNTATE